MKNIIFIFYFLFFIICTGFAQTGWRELNPYPTGTGISSISFINNNTGFFVGLNNLVYKTTNTGLNWYRTEQGAEKFLNKILFKDQSTGFIVGDNGLVNRTTNGGLNWVGIQGIPGDYYSTGIYYLSNKWFLTGYWWTNGFTYGYFGSSTDNGLNWSLKIFDSLDFHTMSKDVYFYDESTGYVVGYASMVVKTTNGGLNWNLRHIDNGYSNLTSVYFLNAQTGFISGWSGVLIKTTNAGDNWFNVIDSINYNDGFNKILFINNTTGFAVGNKIFKTTNAGNNWRFVFQNTGHSSNYTSVVYTENKLIAAGLYGEIAISTNYGDNWSRYTQSNDSLTSFSDIRVINPSIVYAAGGGYNIYKSTNGGANWVKQEYIIGSKLHFLNANTGFVISENGYAMYKTTNGGNDWLDIGYPGNDKYKKIKFINANIGVVGGYEWNTGISALLYSTNGGLNWTRNSYPSMLNLSALEMTDSNTIYLGNDEIYKSTNRGNNWTKQTNFSYMITDIKFLNASTGYALYSKHSNYYQVLKTTNGGVEWIQVNSGGANLTQLWIVDSSTVYGVGFYQTWNYSYGIIIKSTNNGIDWSTDYITNAKPIYSISFANKNLGMVGGSSLFLKYSPDYVLYEKTEIINIPKQYHLHQNYPNPFNSSTRIKFDVPIVKSQNSFSAIQNVSIKVYDLLGREITTLINGNYFPGTFEVMFDGSSLSSGIYFYRLTAGDYSETKKLVLLK